MLENFIWGKVALINFQTFLLGSGWMSDVRRRETVGQTDRQRDRQTERERIIPQSKRKLLQQIRNQFLFRFLTMLAHLILTLTLLLSREENVKACLPFDYSQEDFDRKDVELAAGLGVAVGLLVRFHFGFNISPCNLVY